MLLSMISKKLLTTSTFVFGFSIRLLLLVLVLHYWWIWDIDLLYGFRVLARTLCGLLSAFSHFKLFLINDYNHSSIILTKNKMESVQAKRKCTSGRNMKRTTIGLNRKAE
jgi:hypothetical protein